MQTESGPSIAAVDSTPPVIDTAEVTAEALVSPEKLVDDLTKLREQMAALLGDTDNLLEAAKAQEQVRVGQIVTVEKPAPIPVSADQLPPGAEAQAALNSAMLGAAAEAVTGARSAEVVTAETIAPKPINETPAV